MMFLWLPMLAIFALAFAYFALLCIAELVRIPRAHAAPPREERTHASEVTPIKRLTAELRFMTREMSPLFGFGDD